MKPLLAFLAAFIAMPQPIRNKSTLEKKVYPVPLEIDQEIARIKLLSMGIEIDRLSKEQAHYLASWEQGT